MSTKPYVVVTGTDFSEHAVRALRVAYEQASMHAPAEVHVVHASLMASPEPSPAMAARLGCETSPVQSLEEQREQLERHLEGQLAQLVGYPRNDVKVFGHVILEIPSLSIVTLAGQLHASLIVIGSHGVHGFARWLLGSVAEGVVRQAECPVLVVPPPAKELPSPRIEPPCPRCAEARAATNNRSLWCDQHRERHGRRHTYYQADRINADGNMPLVMR
jgi:nucleotide-binding universal stress UspA family protein